MRKIIIGLLILASCSFTSVFGQTAPVKPKADILTVVNEEGNSFEFTAADLAKLPRKQLKAADHNGAEMQLEGYAVADILKLAGLKLGEGSMRGKRIGKYLLVEANDNYKAVFSLTEFDPDYTDAVILLADKMDAKPLTPEFGPWYLVVPNQKMHGRWVREVAKLSVRTAEPSVASTKGDASDEEAIYEAIFREMLTRWYKRTPQPSENYYLEIQGKNGPSDALMQRLSNLGTQLRKGSEAFVSAEEGSIVLDKKTKKQGVLFVIYKFEWISKDEAKVTAGDHVGNMGASGCTYRVRREADGWKIYRTERCSIS